MLRHATTLSCIAFIGCMLFVALSPLPHQQRLTIYALSFWHYYAYWLAYRHGAVALDVFMRDSILLKTVSLAALGVAYVNAAPDGVSLAVTGLGFLLSAAAAWSLGAERTYYGSELRNLPPLRLKAFPFNILPHPMLTGNIVAYAGTLINEQFRSQWWPLACFHIILNASLVVMEAKVTPMRGRRDDASEDSAFARTVTRDVFSMFSAIAAGALLGGAADAWLEGGTATLPFVTVGSLAAVHAIVMFRWYTSPAYPPEGRAVEVQVEETS